jgi:hypothetical protein
MGHRRVGHLARMPPARIGNDLLARFACGWARICRVACNCCAAVRPVRCANGSVRAAVVRIADDSF